MPDRKGQSPKETALRKYFMKQPDQPPKGKPTALIVVGASFTVLGLIATIAGGQQAVGCLVIGLIPGLIMIGIGAMMLAKINAAYRAKVSEGEPKPSDLQVQSWLDEGIRKLSEHSRGKLNLDESEGSISAPLIIAGPILWDTGGVSSDDLVWKRGEDGLVRFGVYRVTIILLTDRHLTSYACDYNFIRDVALNERTDEFHYRDIVSVSTREQDTAYTLPTGKKMTKAQAFSLSVASGESISVMVDSAEIREITGVEKLPETGADKAVANIRAMLRDKKG